MVRARLSFLLLLLPLPRSLLFVTGHPHLSSAHLLFHHHLVTSPKLHLQPATSPKLHLQPATSPKLHPRTAQLVIDSPSLPQPFDMGLGDNFTSPTCPDFFRRFLADDDFRQCFPLSLLLETSDAFFQASLPLLTQTLDASCNISSPDRCSLLLADLADHILLDSTCGPDAALGNPTVAAALAGFQAFEPLQRAACLRNDTGDYCFADAATDRARPSSNYVYFLALGVPWPDSAPLPSCSSCLNRTLDIFHEYSGNHSQPLHRTLPPVADLADDACSSDITSNAPRTSGGFLILSSIFIAMWITL